MVMWLLRKVMWMKKRRGRGDVIPRRDSVLSNVNR